MAKAKKDGRGRPKGTRVNLDLYIERDSRDTFYKLARRAGFNKPARFFEQQYPPA